MSSVNVLGLENVWFKSFQMSGPVQMLHVAVEREESCKKPQIKLWETDRKRMWCNFEMLKFLTALLL